MTPCRPSRGYQLFGDRCCYHFRRKAKMVAEDRVDNFGEFLNGSGAQMIRLRTAFSCEFRFEFRQILCVILQVRDDL